MNASSSTAMTTMRAITHTAYGSADVLALTAGRPAGPFRQRGAAARARGRRGPRRLAHHDRQAVPGTARVRAPVAPTARCSASRSPARSTPSAPQSPGSRSATRSTASRRAPSPSTPSPARTSSPPSRRNLTLRAGRGRARLRRHRPAGADRRRPRPAGPDGAGHRRLRRRGQLRRADRQGPRRRGDRRGQHRRSSTWCGRWAPTTSWTTPTTTSPTAAARYDLVLDIAGNPTLSRLRRALTRTGTAVIVGGEEGGSFSGGMNRQLRALALSPFVRQRLTMFIAKQRSSDLERLTDLIEAGSVTPSVEQDLPAARGRRTPCATWRPATSEARSPSASEREPARAAAVHTSGKQDRP